MFKILVVSAVSLLVLIQTTSASADDFKKDHPRRAQVKGRANKQEGKNAKAEAEGKITKKQENKLNRQDQAIKREEKSDASKNGGTITKGEQEHMNQQENHVTEERNNMEKRDASQGQ